MNIPRLVHRRIDLLSSRAKEILIAGFRGKKSAGFISKAIREATGEDLAERSVSRAGSNWRLAERLDGNLRVAEEFGLLDPSAQKKLIDLGAEVVDLVKQLDFSRTWRHRRKKFFRLTLAQFFATPDAENLRAVIDELISYSIEFAASARREEAA